MYEVNRENTDVIVEASELMADDFNPPGRLSDKKFTVRGTKYQRNLKLVLDSKVKILQSTYLELQLGQQEIY